MSLSAPPSPPAFLSPTAVRSPARRGWAAAAPFLGGVLAIIGIVMTLLTARFVVTLSGDYYGTRPTRTPLLGTAVTLLGYLCALVGAALLPDRANAHT